MVLISPMNPYVQTLFLVFKILKCRLEHNLNTTESGKLRGKRKNKWTLGLAHTKRILPRRLLHLVFLLRFRAMRHELHPCFPAVKHRLMVEILERPLTVVLCPGRLVPSLICGAVLFPNVAQDAGLVCQGDELCCWDRIGGAGCWMR